MLNLFDRLFFTWWVVFTLTFQVISLSASHMHESEKRKNREWKVGNFKDFGVICDRNAEYRTMDGRCNNPYDPNLGKAFTPFKRYLCSNYEDGLETPFKNRPDPRFVSRKLFKANEFGRLEKSVNLFLAIYGQFLSHDLAHAAPNDPSIKCCPKASNPKECMQILLKRNDPLRKSNITCLNFVRSKGIVDKNTASREQENTLTHFIDASMVYGSSEMERDELYNNHTAKMKVTKAGPHTKLLPLMDSTPKKKNCPLFNAGDKRVNENILLVVLHTIWIREHNFIVEHLRKKPRFRNKPNAKMLFEEARKILIAEMQHVTYNEFLPLVIGNEFMHKYKLYSSYPYGYNALIDPRIANAFTTAAFRFGHPMIGDHISFYQNNTNSTRIDSSHFCRSHPKPAYSCDTSPVIKLERLFANSEMMFSCENSMDASVMGSVSTLAHAPNDESASESLTLHSVDIHDLISFNIQRGRDHGLPPYNRWREWCGLDVLTHTSSSSHNPSILRHLRRIYRHPDKIDLFVGAILEKKMHEDSLLGPTFGCIIANQFFDLKYGDRFWYQNGQFSEGQISEIECQTMSKILLRNTGLSSLPANAFKVESFENEKIDKSRSHFNFHHWS